ncbi:flavin reductase [Actinomadura rugatobispora]|uniref:Flavin reductase n=1 Tax=Actinomadura rugatobispora TaxID=1994 RepID=A0ABW1AAD8_9ACTN|nr:flavin reductase [Actinomadura rugatobispora]
MTDTYESAPPVDPQWFRQVLGQYPTGVCAVTARGADGGPVGMVVGSFASASLDPPLVAFFADRKSTTWPKIAQAGSFCVNVLGADQESLCQRLSSKDPRKFEGVDLRDGPTGAPVLERSVAWLDCVVHAVQDAGDHFLVLGRVIELHIEEPRLPLLFFRGGYGRFAPISLAAPDPTGHFTRQLRYVELVRDEIEDLSRRLRARCALAALVDDEMVVVGTADAYERPGTAATLVGQRLPFLAPIGAVFAAWSPERTVEDWLAGGDPRLPAGAFRESLEAIRSRGYSVGLLSDGQRDLAVRLDEAAAQRTPASVTDFYGMAQRLRPDPVELTPEDKLAVRQISVPVVGAEGQVVLALTVYGFPKPRNGIDEYVDQILAAARAASSRIGATEGRPSIPAG